jgi:hypothetical protein
VNENFSAWGSHDYGPIAGVVVGSAMGLAGLIQGIITPDALMPVVVGLGGLALAATNFGIIIANRLERGRVQRHLIRVQGEVDEARIRAGLPAGGSSLSRSGAVGPGDPGGITSTNDLASDRRPSPFERGGNHALGADPDQHRRAQAQSTPDPDAH